MISPQTVHNYDEHAALDDVYVPCNQCGVYLVPDDMPEYLPDGTVLCPDCAETSTQEGTPMLTLDQARDIACQWHGGGGSPLYSFASTSGHGKPENITPATIAEVDENIAWCQEHADEHDREQTGMDPLPQLRAYLIANLPDQPEDECQFCGEPVEYAGGMCEACTASYFQYLDS